MNKKIIIALALASLFIATNASVAQIVCYGPTGTADTNCATCPSSAWGVCATCKTGYFVSGSAATNAAVCTACATGCATCSSATVCTAAASGYYLNSGTPVANTNCGTGCTTCASTGCTAIASGYVIVSNAAVACSGTTSLTVRTCDVCTSATAGTCTDPADGYFLAANSGAGPDTPAACATGCAACTSATASTCTAALPGYYLTANPGTATANAACATGCTTCASGGCTAAATGYVLLANPGTPTACTDTLNAAACTTAAATVSGTCNFGTKDTNNICCGVQYCSTCQSIATATNANNLCATASCATGYTLQSDNTCNCVTNCLTCASSTLCSACKSGYTATGTSPSITACVASTPVPSTSSPGSAFNVTPAVVYTTTDTTSPAFTAVSGTPIFGPGADSTSAYVWLAVNPASTTGSTYSINKRTVNTSGTFAKSNTTADVAITTGVLSSASVSSGTAPGWMWIVSINCGYSGTSCNWNSIGGTAVTQEITLNYVAGTGSSMTTKALTGNTNANVFFNVKSSWYNNGTIYVAYVMSTRTTGATTGSVADTWAANGLYIQGVNVTSGALYYNTTGGVKAIAMTQTASGASTCIATTGSGCASNYYSGTGVGDALSSFTVYAMNWTTTDTVQYTWVDRTSTTAIVYKTGTINCTTGAATSGTTLATSAADAVSGTTTTSTSYSFLGALASMGTYGVFIKKTVGTTVGSAATTYVYTIQGFLNGSSTANTNFTVASGYQPTGIMGYHTSDGFVLMETQSSTAATTPAQPYLLQAERFFTNGSAYSTAVNLGTYGASASTYQDTNGSIIVGYTIYDTLTSKTYSGYMGTYIAQNLAGVSLTTIFGLLSFMIVALFAF